MIKQLRLDERLIHGQITTQWSKVLDVDSIVVANDKIANDEMTKQVLLMTVPAGKKVTVRTVERTIKLLSDPRAANMKILLIVGRPEDIPPLVRALDIKDINLGNFKKSKTAESRVVTTNVVLDPAQFKLMKELSDEGYNVFSQIIPGAEKFTFKDLEDKWNKEKK